MFRWFCLKCGKTVWNCHTCECGNTSGKNAELYKERERQKRIDRIMNERQ